MAKGKGTTGILLEFGRGSGDGPDEDAYDAEEGDDLESSDEPERPTRDPQALIGAIERDLAELRLLLAETG